MQNYPPQTNWEHFSEVIKHRDRSVKEGKTRRREKRILRADKQTNVSKKYYSMGK